MHQAHYSFFSLPTWYLVFFFLGLLSLTRLCFFLVTSIYVYIFRPAKNLTSYGKWSIVTGPTSGIGRSIAFELARNGMNLILVGRNPDKLDQVKSELVMEHKSIDTKVVLFDLSGDIAKGITRLREAISDVDVGVLVNNAGLAEPTLAYFHEINIEAWIKMVRVNLESWTQITRAVLPTMLEKKKGALLNIGSGSAIVFPSWPLITVYTATKSFVAQLSQGLHLEYEHHGIDVQCQIPLLVATNMTGAVEMPKYCSCILINSDKYARAAIRGIGYNGISMPNVSHFLEWCIVSLVPDFIVNKLMLTTMLKVRKIDRMLREQESLLNRSRII